MTGVTRLGRLALAFFLLYYSVTAMLPGRLGEIMKLSSTDKVLLSNALNTEIARVKRAANTQCSVAIKEILGQEMQALLALQGRVHNEPVVEVSK